MSKLAALIVLALPSCVVSFPDYGVGRLDASAGAAGTGAGGSAGGGASGGVGTGGTAGTGSGTGGGVGTDGGGANTGGTAGAPAGGSAGGGAGGSFAAGGSLGAAGVDAATDSGGQDAPSDGSNICGGGTLYFYEPFANNDAGWTLGTEWQIGPATAGPTPSRGWPDPAQDHTPTSDNGVAGVVIGGNASTVRHPAYYLTSPPIDLSGASTVRLSFWRWLNSDSGGYISDTIDVWTGSLWQPLWTNPVGSGLLITDSAWTWFEYDVSAYKNAAFQVRFGIAVLLNGAYSMSSWNLDDIVVSSQSCP